MSKVAKLDLVLSDMGLARKGYPLAIAGPCSAETEEQVMATARGIAAIKEVTVFRAGIWKPRTRPNCFEGVGEPALAWLAKVKQETGLLTACEVANAVHVRKALAAGVDVLWIGARTTVSPFAIQEIANALEGVDIPVFVKNPVNPDLALWMGALERINQAGITKLGAIHRGFSTYEKIRYRNAPKWDLATALHEACPELPIINDPSHISGKAEYVPHVAAKAMELGMSGVMIETHIDPANAWSDASQQLRPEELALLLADLSYMPTESNCENNLLSTLRGEIDTIDRELLEMISVRSGIADRIGEYKKENHMSPVQLSRWREVLEDRLEQAVGLGLNREIIRQIYKSLHRQSLQRQTS